VRGRRGSASPRRCPRHRASFTRIASTTNPGLHDAARRLVASGDVETRERLDEGLPTSGLAVIDFAGKNWRELHPRGGRLERFVSPRSLAEADRA
jgi:hypothetical protein